MTSNPENSVVQDCLKKEEALSLLKENCENFLKMSHDEKSEGLKINYLLGIVKLSDNFYIYSYI